MNTLSMPHAQFRAAVLNAARMSRHKVLDSLAPVVSFRPGDGHVIVEGIALCGVFKQRVAARIDGQFSGEPFSLFRDTIARLAELLPGGGDVMFRHDGGSLRIETGTFAANVVKHPDPPMDAPAIVVPETTFRIDKAAFRATFGAVRYAVPRRDHRRVLMGVLAEIRDGELRTTATDGKRLRRTTAPIPCDGRNRIVVPHEAIPIALGAFDGEDIEVAISSDGRVRFRGESWEVCSIGLEGKYPECDAVIPKEFGITVEVHRKSIIDALRRAATFSEDRNKSIIIDAKAEGATLSAMAVDVGRSVERIAASLTGAPVEIAFNHELLAEAMMQFPKATQVRILIKSEQSPVRFEADGGNGDLVVMPIKLADLRGEEYRPVERAA